MTLDDVYKRLLQGDLSVMTKEVIMYINSRTVELINIASGKMVTLNCILDTVAIHEIEVIVLISNLIYNNTDCSLLPLEDEVYDKLQNIYKEYFPNSYKIGAPPVQFESTNENVVPTNAEAVFPFYYPEMKKKDMMFAASFYERNRINFGEILEAQDVTKRVREVAHLHPNLAGTLDKCNFVLINDARIAGIDVEKDMTTKIFERDFMHKNARLFGLNLIPMVVMLKYDGVAIEADCTDAIISARTRGDTSSNTTTDVTPILGGYKFPNAKKTDVPVGIQFEAIIDYYNLQRLNELTGKSYANARTAIIGILGMSDAPKYRDFITLVPVDADLPGVNKIDRLEFCNNYYATRIKCLYEYFCADFNQTLYLVHRFVQEAEAMRSYLPFMYDGVVSELVDESMVHTLGRKNSVNQYMMAIKFNAVRKLTRFTGYSYSVGQNGEIVPKLHYMAVALMGTVHTKTTGHSYNRFKELALKEGDIIQIEYRNDVIPYASKPMIPDNIYNMNPEIQFPTMCPACGSPVYFTDKQAFCTNFVCPERNLKRVTNMIAKLDIRDVSEERIKLLNIFWFRELMELSSEKIYAILGEAIGDKLITQINNLKLNPIEDYKIIGAIGFSNLAESSWKLILSAVSLDELLYLNDASITNRLMPIKGLGKEKVNTVKNQRPFFQDDIAYIMHMPNVIRTTGMCAADMKKICMSNVRLTDEQKNMIYTINPNVEITDKSVTKDTTILLVPCEGFMKTKKCNDALKHNIPIVPINVFMSNPNLYI